MIRDVFGSFEAAVGHACKLIEADPQLDQVMIIPTAQFMGMAMPKPEGKTHIIECTVLMDDAWHIVTRDDLSDGVALQATSHTFEAFDEAMIKAGVAAHEQAWNRDHLNAEEIVKAVFRAMYMAMPWPSEDLDEDSLERAHVDLPIRDEKLLRVMGALMGAATASGEREVADLPWRDLANEAIKVMRS